MTTEELDDLSATVATLRTWVDAGTPDAHEDIAPQLRRIVALAEARSSAVVVRLLADLLSHPVLLVRRTAIASCDAHLDSLELRRRLALLAWWDPGEAGREDARLLLEEHGHELASLRGTVGL